MCDLRKLDKIIPSISNEKCILWVGSGLSCIAGCSGWSNMIDEILAAPFIEYRLEDFKGAPLQEILTTCRKKFEEADHLSSYKAIIQNAISYKQDFFKEKYKLIVESLMKIKPKIPFITTNIDSCLERTYLFKDTDRFWEREHFRRENIRGGSIVHLHGIAEKFEKGIWERKDYLDQYGDKDYLDFLKYLTNVFSVLFIGMGLKEPDIMKFFNEDSTQKSFALLPEDEWNNALYDTWSQRNVELINYGKKDDLGEVLKVWVDRNFPKTVSLESFNEDISRAK